MSLLFSLPRTRQRKQQVVVVLIFICFLLLLHFILKLESTNERSFSKLDIEIPINFVPVRVTAREPLPSDGSLKIPKRIHQTWKSTFIPPQFAQWIKTWLLHHPGWEYWLWTDESARELISLKYPSLLSTFDSYDLPVRKADALRYVVLYEYGGIYADMDIEAVSSLEPLARKYSCFIGQEPYEHPVLDSNFQQLLINALMGCQAGHPFFKRLIDNLPAFSTMWHFLDSTGPHFVTTLYRQFHQNVNSNIYIAPSEYFYPTMDPSKIGYFITKCNNVNKLTKLQKNACRNLKYKNLQENFHDPLKIAFTNHHWYHTYFQQMASAVPIHQIVSNVTIYQRGLAHK